MAQYILNRIWIPVLALGTTGCSLFLTHATPAELGALPEDDRSTLARFEDERLRYATEWQFATRDRKIAQAEYDAVRAKKDVADDLKSWAVTKVDVARLRMATENEKSLNNCRNKYAALAELHEVERIARRSRLESQKADEAHQRARYELAVAEQERARIAIVTDKPGVLKEDREKILGRWNDEVASRKTNADEKMISHKQSDLRAGDAEKAFAGEVLAFKKRFDKPCPFDWQLPEDSTLGIPGNNPRIEVPKTRPPVPVATGLTAPPVPATTPEQGTALDEAEAAPMMDAVQETSPLLETE